MESHKPFQWIVSVGRNARCNVCNGRLRLPCPKCRNSEGKKKCKIFFNRQQGHKHRHCYVLYYMSH